jgi:16S rRNA (cytosine967-C5)-methyltransferase
MNARDYAIHELHARNLPGWGRVRLRRPNIKLPADPRDRALGEQITLGVTKNLLLLRALAAHHAGRGLRSIDPLVQMILCVALYQLRFLTRVPASAAVDEAVEQTRRLGAPRASSFVNAVLRNATRNPDPDDLPEHIRLSHPKELFDRLVELLGHDDAVKLCTLHNTEPPTIVRLLSRGRAELLPEGATPVESDGFFALPKSNPKMLHDLLIARIAQVQDPTAALAAAELEVRTGHVVLDRCCGVGTKFVQMIDRLDGSGQIVGIDPNGQRCDTLRRTLVEMQARNWRVMQSETLAALAGELPERFDRILIDVPCSNSGVLARRPEARYRQTAQALKSLRKLQLQILADTAAALAPDGRLVYSTCSIWHEENASVVDEFLARQKLRKLSERLTLPSLDPDTRRWHDGGYVAVLARR